MAKIFIVLISFILATVVCPVHGLSRVYESMADSYAAYMMGLRDVSRGNFPDAQKWFKAAYELDQGSVEILTELARNAIQLGKIQEAQHWTELALELEPDNQDLLLLLARILIQQDKVKDALDAIEQILKKDPKNQQALVMAGTLYAESRDWKRAEKVLKKAVRLGGSKAFMAYYFLGKVAREKGEYKAAEFYFRQAIGKNSFFSPALFELAEVYERENKVDEAIKTYRSLLFRQRGNLKARQKLLLLLLEKGHKKEALEQIEILKQISKKDTNVQFRIALVLLQLGMPRDALEILVPLRQRLPDNPDLAFYTGLAYEQTGRLFRAQEIFAGIPLDAEPGVDAVIHRARILSKRGLRNQSIRILKDALAKMPNKVQLVTSLASLYQKAGKERKALEVLEQGLKKNPDNKGLIMTIVMSLDSSGKRHEAIKYARKALALDKDFVPALNYIGYTYAEMGKKLDEAERLIKKAVSLAPNDGFILDSLGWVYFKKGELDKGITYLKKARDLVPDDPIIAEHLGDAYAARQMFDKALAQYRNGLKNAKKATDKRRLKKKIARTLDAIADIPDI